MSGVAYVFPGQGSQRVGMGRALALRPFRRRGRSSRKRTTPLVSRCPRSASRGPRTTFELTANTQPALVAASVAALRCYRARGLETETPDFVAGHSLGEYSALVAAGALELGDALRLVRARGEAMQKAVPVGQGCDGRGAWPERRRHG